MRAGHWICAATLALGLTIGPSAHAQHFLPEEPESRASRALNAAEVQKNADGSVDIYFGPKAPAGKDANWVPTDPQRDFELMFRLYGPKKEFFDKVWRLPDVERIAAQ